VGGGRSEDACAWMTLRSGGAGQGAFFPKASAAVGIAPGCCLSSVVFHGVVHDQRGRILDAMRLDPWPKTARGQLDARERMAPSTPERVRRIRRPSGGAKELAGWALAQRRFLRGQISLGRLKPSTRKVRRRTDLTTTSLCRRTLLDWKTCRNLHSFLFPPLSLSLSVPLTSPAIDTAPASPSHSFTCTSTPTCTSPQPIEHGRSQQLTRRRILREAWKMHTPRRPQRRSSTSR
jgi:hypothetical protein